MRFAFGKNWQSYSANALTAQRIEQARHAFGELLTGIDVQQKRFVDIGFGQGLSLVVAAEMGADVLGIDIDADNLEALKTTQQAMGCDKPLRTRIASILDDEFAQSPFMGSTAPHGQYAQGDRKRLHTGCRRRLFCLLNLQRTLVLADLENYQMVLQQTPPAGAPNCGRAILSCYFHRQVDRNRPQPAEKG